MNNVIDNMNPYTFTGSAFIIAFFLVNELTPDEQGSIGNWLQLVGMAVLTYASQVTTNQSVQNNNESDDNGNDNTSDIDTLKKAIDKIKSELENLKKNN